MSLSVPNLLSLFRMALIPVFVIAVVSGFPGRALAVFALAGITDALDGFLARFFHQESALGSYLDPMADKLLLTTAYVLLAIPLGQSGVHIPVWVTVLVIARDVVIVVVALVLYLALGVSSFPPTFVSKINTAAQIVGLVLVLLSRVVMGFDGYATVWLYVVVALTVGSGLDYVYRANRMVETSETVAG